MTVMKAEVLLEGENNGFVDDERLDEFGGRELWVAIVKDLIHDFI